MLSVGGNYLSCNLTSLCYTKDNEINVLYPVLKKQKMFTINNKNFMIRDTQNIRIQYEPCLEMDGNIFSVVLDDLDDLFLSCYFKAFCSAHTVLTPLAVLAISNRIHNLLLERTGESCF